jgi:hypothetical protein
MLAEAAAGNKHGKIFYFNGEDKFDDVEGSISKIEEEPGLGVFVCLAGEKVRADRIITLFGKPGPAFDEYDAFGNACMDCTGGYPL